MPTCAEAGVLGVLAGMAGTFQANEALKILLGIGEPLVGRLLLMDALAARVREIVFERDPNCSLCGAKPEILSAVEMVSEEQPVAAEEIEPALLDAALAAATLIESARTTRERAWISPTGHCAFQLQSSRRACTSSIRRSRTCSRAV